MIAIDSNILLYVEGVGDTGRQDLATDILSRLDYDTVCVANQALGELYWVLLRKGKVTRSQANYRVSMWQSAVTTLPTTTAAFQSALELATVHNLQIWDAIILAVAAEYGCKCLLSEDMQDGFVWRGVEIINPLNDPGMKRITAAIE